MRTALTLHRHALWLLTAPLLAGPAFAQFSPPGTVPSYQLLDSDDWITWSSSGLPAPGVFRRSVAGDFTSDGLNDVVTVAGNDALLMWNPALCGSHTILASSINDVAVARGTGPGGSDQLASVGALGLRLTSMGASPMASWSTVNVGSNAWFGANVLDCAEADATPGPDFVGINVDATKLITRLNGQSSDILIATGASLVDVCFVQWFGDTRLEVAALTTAGIEIWNVANHGTLITSFAGTDGVSLARVRHASGSDSVAAVFRPSTGQQLRIVSSTQPYDSSITLPGGSIQFRTLTAGDLDLDGSDDLVLETGRWINPIVVMSGSGTLHGFGQPSSWVTQIVHNQPVLTSMLAGNNVSRPALADLTGDLVPDILLATNQTTNVANQEPAHLLLTSLGELPNPPVIAWNPLSLDIMASFLSTPTPSTSQRWAYVRLDRGQLPAEADGVQITAWREPYYAQSIVTPPEHYAVHAFADANGAALSGVIGIPFQIAESDDCFLNAGGATSGIHYVQIVPLKYTQNGGAITVEQRWSPRIAAICGNPGDLIVMKNKTTTETSEPMLDASGLSIPANTGLLWTGWCGGGSSGTTPAPAIIGRRRLPNFGNGQTPNNGNAPNVPAPAATIPYVN